MGGGAFFIVEKMNILGGGERGGGGACFIVEKLNILGGGGDAGAGGRGGGVVSSLKKHKTSEDIRCLVRPSKIKFLSVMKQVW